MKIQVILMPLCPQIANSIELSSVFKICDIFDSASFVRCVQAVNISASARAFPVRLHESTRAVLYQLESAKGLQGV